MSSEFKKIKTVELKIYPFSVTFFLLNKGIKFKDDEGNIEKNVAARTILKENNNIFIMLSNNDICSLVHECFHATAYIMCTIGESSIEIGNETWAYLIEYLTKEGIDFLK